MLNTFLAAAAEALPDNLVEAISTIIIAVLSWYISRKKTQAREREK